MAMAAAYATASNEDEWSLTMGNMGALIWSSPPRPACTLLRELFIEQPEEVLAWLHQAVWSLQQQEFLAALQSSPRTLSNHLQVRAPDLPPCREEAHERQACAPALPSVPPGHQEELPDVGQDREKATAPEDEGCDGSNEESRLARAGSPIEESAGKVDSPRSEGPLTVLLKRPRSADSSPTIGSRPWDAPSPVSAQSSASLSLQFGALSPMGRQSTPCSPRVSRMGGVDQPESVPETEPATSLHHILPSVPQRASSFRASTVSRDSRKLVDSRRSSAEVSVARFPSDKSSSSKSVRMTTLNPSGSGRWHHQGEVVKIPSTKSSKQTPSRSGSHSSTECISCNSSNRGKSSRFVSVFPSPSSSSLLNVRGRTSSVRNSLGMRSTWIYDFMGGGSRGSEANATQGAGFEIDTSILGIYDHLNAGWRLLSPMSSMWILWEFVWFACVLHELWVVPFDLIFVPNEEFQDGFKPVAAAVSACFVIDIIMQCVEVFSVGSSWLIEDALQHFAPHAKSWLLFDVVLTLADCCLLINARSMKRFKLVKLCRGLRLERAWHDLDMAIALKGHVISSHLFAHILQLNLVILLLSHIHGVIWATLHAREWMPVTMAEAYARYLDSLWGACLAMTFGGEVPASTQSQQILGIIVSLERTSIIGIVLFFFVKCAQDHYGMRSQENRLREFVAGYLRDVSAPPIAQLAVLQKIQESHKARNMQMSFDFISGQQVAAQFRVMLADVCWRSKLMSLGLVCDLMSFHPGFARELTNSIEAEFAPTFTVLYHYDETCHDAYYILSGVLEILFVEDHSEPQEPYTTGMWVGEKALVNHELRTGETIATKTFAELMVVSGTDFKRLLRRFELTSVCDDLIKANLWLGFCGRCGLFGDHFKKECPLLKDDKQNQGFLRRMLPKSLKRPVRSGLFGKDLRVFLQTYQLERLLQPLHNLGVRNLSDLTPDLVRKLSHDPDMKLSEEEVQVFKSRLELFRKRHAIGATRILANTGSFENYYIFISHYKEESGTEAALMHEGLQQLISKMPGSPGHDLASPVFLDTEDLTDLATLREHVSRSHNLLLLLTNNVLKRPWVLLEICTAIETGVAVLPVEIQAPGQVKFKYPDEEYYRQLMDGSGLDASAMEMLRANDVSVEQLCKALRMVFNKIASPYSPQKSAAIRKAELRDILKRCETKIGRASLTTDWKQIGQIHAQRTSSSPVHSEMLPSWLAPPRVSTIRSDRMDNVRSLLNRQAIPESEDDYGEGAGQMSTSSATKRNRTGSFGTPAGAAFSSIDSLG